MKRCIILSALAVTLAFIIPLIYSLTPRGREMAAAAPSPAPTSAPATEDMESASISGENILDGDITISVLTDSGVEEMSMAEYLPGALAGEMPASFESEALKAQAVALRSYILFCGENRKSAHPDADICGSSTCCTAHSGQDKLRESWGEKYEDYYEKIRSAVSATDGQYLVYEDEPILAVFHSSSSGVTEEGGNIWSARPYLLSVSSPETAEEVRNFRSTVEVSAEDFKSTVLASFPGADMSGQPESWLGDLTRNSSGRVGSLSIGGVEVGGLSLRQMFALRSTDFTLDYTDGVFRFSVEGYGHGVGMSQYGANTMAASGADYAEILSHYYPGTELVRSVLVG